MRKISTKLILLLILSALIPITLFGSIAIWTARETARDLVAEENLQVAKRAAQQIEQYFTNSLQILEALAQNLAKTDLEVWQKERVVKNYTLQFDQFGSLVLADRAGRAIVTSRLESGPEDSLPGELTRVTSTGGIYHSDVYISENFVPVMNVAVPVVAVGEFQGTIMAELHLVEMWKLVDSIRIGREGYAWVVSKEGLLIAHGRNSEKEQVLRQKPLDPLPIAEAALRGEMRSMIYKDREGLDQIGVSVPVENLGWGLVIEQPTREAYKAARHMTVQLSILIVIFLVLMILIGGIGGRRYLVNPIRALIEVTRGVGGGNLTQKVEILTRDEFQELGETFNRMTDRLMALKEDIRINERAVFLGKIASGLVHDLKHPIKNIENSSRLLIRSFDDPAHRTVFKKVVEREFGNFDRFLDDLLHFARPAALEPIFLGLSPFFKELSESVQAYPQCVIHEFGMTAQVTENKGKIHVSFQVLPPGLRVMADRFALERVMKNLITNAIEAMPYGGRLTVLAEAAVPSKSTHGLTYISVSDTGCGIPPEHLKTLFKDFSTTKHKGMGLGLAVCKKIMEEHMGEIQVRSTPGQGTTFILQFPNPH